MGFFFPVSEDGREICDGMRACGRIRFLVENGEVR